MTSSYLYALALPFLLIGCKPEEPAQTPTVTATDDTPAHALVTLVTGDPRADEMQLSTKVDPHTGKCLGPDVFVFSGGNQFEWIDLKVLRKSSGIGPMIRGDFTFENNVIHVTNAKATDILGQTLNKLPDRDLELTKISNAQGNSVFIIGKQVSLCLLTMGDVIR